MSLAPTFEEDVSVGTITLANGNVLHDVIQRVSIYGTARSDGSNVMLVPHALTGSGRLPEWWEGFVGPSRTLDTNRLALVGINVLGSCYGSTGPSSLADDGKPYGSRFPVLSVGDMVTAQQAALSKLGIGRMAGAIGGSLGGMQVLQWIVREPQRFRHGIVLGAYDYFSAMGIALNSLSRAAIVHDPHFVGGDYYDGPAPSEGVHLARMIAMATYKSEALFAERFGRRFERAAQSPANDPRAVFDVESYLEYQGKKFVSRMDANTYLTLIRAMDLFDIRDEATPEPGTKLTFVGIDSDWLFTAAEISGAAERFRRRGYQVRSSVLNSTHGHDAFLTDLTELSSLIAPALDELYAKL
jgi:homoserine O-acetyltransferase